jgi:hypothetical protein
MSVAEDFVTYLNTEASVTAVVSTRIAQAPAHIQFKLPYIVFRRRGRVEQLTLGGEGGVIETELDVECRAATLDAAEDLADILHGLLNGERGTWGARTILGVFVTDQDDEYEFLPPGSNSAEQTTTLYVQIFSR